MNANKTWVVTTLLALAVGAQERPGIFRITPVRPVGELRAEALKVAPPKESGDFWQSDLVDLAGLESRI
jgi:D-alanyl-D-alanine dipeptidase